MHFQKNDIVVHDRFGQGQVRSDEGETVIVRFQSGLEECLSTQLRRLESPEEKAQDIQLENPQATLARVMGHCIRSVNDEWGVLACSRIQLLPHQLWVCRQVLERWPMRWLIADDVGLGKTIEAGLILSSLLAAKRIRRLLIIAPASLTKQWQRRMLSMFDIRLSLYHPEDDTPRTNYWSGPRMVVASMETLRKNSKKRWDRLITAEAWDLVIVDEAHHLHADERTGHTLSLSLLDALEKQRRIISLLLFTGTPHRGKNYGFLALLRLLKPSVFSEDMLMSTALNQISSVMLRNNKHKITDMHGNKLFTPVHTQTITYNYSESEAEFYDKLTEFIMTGRAYAQDLAQGERRIVMFVLLTMQKLASSSVAAVRRALRGRLNRLHDMARQEADMQLMLSQLTESIGDECDDTFSTQSEESIAHAVVQLPQEIAALEILLQLAEAIEEETKLTTILDTIEKDYPNESILFFTEYKATQALLVRMLRNLYGEQSVSFINGDEFLLFENTAGETLYTETMKRDLAAHHFNTGKVRFLVSTEAAGEGIDLQGHCHIVFHVDLPWNPMRLHQRVGRISRYGQKHPVAVRMFRNPETVEGIIWECLEEKLQRITLAFQSAMEDPEDMCNAVIGMASPRMFNELFAHGQTNSREGVQSWFNAKTETFGNQDAISLVKRMFGSAKRFDFGTLASNLPQLDLKDLQPFMKLTLALSNRKYKEENPHTLTFKSPKTWEDDYLLADDYRLIFSRTAVCNEDEDLAGMGFLPVDRAVADALLLSESNAAIQGLTSLILVYRMRDRSTESESLVRQRIVGVQKTQNGWQILKDWELLLLLNPLAQKPRALLSATVASQVPSPTDFSDAEKNIISALESLHVPFNIPYLECIACLSPA